MTANITAFHGQLHPLRIGSRNQAAGADWLAAMRLTHRIAAQKKPERAQASRQNQATIRAFEVLSCKNKKLLL
jgi:hypothetical protein